MSRLWWILGFEITSDSWVVQWHVFADLRLVGLPTGFLFSLAWTILNWTLAWILRLYICCVRMSDSLVLWAC